MAAGRVSVRGSKVGAGKRRLKWGSAALFALLAAGYGGYQAWMHTRPQPDPIERELFQGVMYRREIYTKPRPMVAHIVTIDLKAPGIGFLVTPGDPAQSSCFEPERPRRS